MAFVSGAAFARCTFSSSASGKYTHIPSFGIFDVYDAEEADGDDDENSGHSPDDVDDDNSGDVGLLGGLNSEPGLFLLHMMLKLFQPK